MVIAHAPGRLVDPKVVSLARVYKPRPRRTGYQIDRDAADEIVGLVLDVRALAVANYRWAARAPAASRVARGRGVSWVYAGLTYAQAEMLADRLEERAGVYTGAGSHPDDRVAGRACRDAAVKIRAVLAEHGGTT